MQDERPTGGTNARPLDETIAGTGPGIPDDARAPGEDVPEAPGDDAVERARRDLERTPEEEDGGGKDLKA